MDDYHKIITEFAPLEQWQRIAFAAACAERVALIFRSFGSPESQVLYEQGLELTWRSVTQDDLVSQAKKLINKLDKTPESEEDPVIFVYYYAQDALFILMNALKTTVTDDPRPAKWTSDQGLSFRSELDRLLTEESQRVTMYSMSDEPPAGPLEVLELKHQRQTLELIKSKQKPDAELISSLRSLSQEASKDLEFAISEIRKGRK